MIDRLVRRTVTLDAPPEDVWGLLTDADELASWFGAVEGDRITELDGTVRRFVLDEVVEGERLAFTWWAEDGEPSEVTFTIDETDEGTRVTVEERAVLAGGRSCQASVAGISGATAWDDRLLGLELTVLSRSLVLATA
jgi:uncharacterized protein YndB with AHSA1/START domain